MNHITIDQLSNAQKLELMEALWLDLSADAPGFPSPVWHEEALRLADSALGSGTAQFLDWTQAKEILRQRARS